jgi:hypothetical protein
VLVNKCTGKALLGACGSLPHVGKGHCYQHIGSFLRCLIGLTAVPHSSGKSQPTWPQVWSPWHCTLSLVIPPLCLGHSLVSDTYIVSWWWSYGLQERRASTAPSFQLATWRWGFVCPWCASRASSDPYTTETRGVERTRAPRSCDCFKTR